MCFLCLNKSELQSSCRFSRLIDRAFHTTWRSLHIRAAGSFDPASLMFHLLAQFCAHRPHTGPQQCSRTEPLFQIASTQSSVVRGREGTCCPLRTLPHSFEEQPSLIISRHTKRWAPDNAEQIPLCAQVLNISANHCVPSTAPSSFQIPVHE